MTSKLNIILLFCVYTCNGHTYFTLHAGDWGGMYADDVRVENHKKTARMSSHESSESDLRSNRDEKERSSHGSSPVVL